MKTTDERTAQVFQRAGAIRARQRLQRRRVAAWGGGAACIAVLAVASLAIASMGEPGTVAGVTAGEDGLAASVFADSTMLGYFIVGILGAVLGVALTILVYRLGRGEAGSTRAHNAVDVAMDRTMRDDSNQLGLHVQDGADSAFGVPEDAESGADTEGLVAAESRDRHPW